MYEFIDTIQSSSSSTGYPAEAVQINGEYLEDQVTGYKTLYVKGRESLEAEFKEYESDRRNGTTVYAKKYPARTITVGFQIIADSDTAFRTAFNTLNKILANSDDSEFIFDDEPDKYFIGTPISNIEVDPGKNAVTGEWQIYCSDPFKYSTTENSVTVVSESIGGETATVLTATNDGAYKCYPRFEVQFATDENATGGVGGDADCGYVMFAKNETDYSIQAGDDQEKDGEAKTLFNQSFTKSNKGSFADSTSATLCGSDCLIGGSSKADKSGLSASSYGTATSKKFTGPAVVYTLESAASGDFTFQWKQVFGMSNSTTAKKECGCLQVVLLDESDAVVAGVNFYKTSKSNNYGYIDIYDETDQPHREKANFSYTNQFCYMAKTTGKGKKKKTTYSERNSTCSIYRKDDLIDVEFPDASLEEFWSDAKIKKIVFFFGAYGSNKKLGQNRVTWAEFIDQAYDTENTFSSGDLLEMNCTDMNIKLNNAPCNNLGDITNDWENMYLDVGENKIICQWSDFVAKGYTPTITMYYRERWI